MVGQSWSAVRCSSHGWWLRGARLCAVGELGLCGLCSMLHPFVAIGLALDDLLATGLERITEILRMHSRPEMTISAMTVQLVVAVDPTFLIESLLALVAAIGIFGLE